MTFVKVQPFSYYVECVAIYTPAISNHSLRLVPEHSVYLTYHKVTWYHCNSNYIMSNSPTDRVDYNGHIHVTYMLCGLCHITYRKTESRLACSLFQGLFWALYLSPYSWVLYYVSVHKSFDDELWSDRVSRRWATYDSVSCSVVINTSGVHSCTSIQHVVNHTP